MRDEMSMMPTDMGAADLRANGSQRAADAPCAARALQPRRRLVGAAVAMTTIVATIASPALAWDGPVDVSKIRLVAVQNDGRLKTFDTLAREVVRQITGDTHFAGQDPVLTYLDLWLRPDVYASMPLVYVKDPAVRSALMRAAGDAATPADTKAANEDKRLSLRLLALSRVRAVMDELDRDVMRTGREINKLHTAMTLASPDTLARQWLAVPPSGGDAQAAWWPITIVADLGAPGLPMPAATRSEVTNAWQQLTAAWAREDSAAASTALNHLAAVLPTVEPKLYPSPRKLSLEHWYYSTNKLTWGWVIYAAAALFLLMAVVNRWSWSRRIGMALFLGAFSLHTVSTGVRWYLAGRIPNSNMFEAVMAAAWFGGAIAWVFEAALHRRPTRNLFALGASLCAMIAMMCGYFMPISLDSDIANPMPILRTVWLKIHTNLILASYILIGLGFVTASLYLVMRGLVRIAKSPRLQALWGGELLVTTGAADGGSARAAALQYDRMGEYRGTAIHRPIDTFVRTERPRSVTASALRATWLVASLAGAIGAAWLLRHQVVNAWHYTASADRAYGVVVGAAWLLVAVTATIGGPAALLWLLARTAGIVFGRDDAAHLVRRSPLAPVLDGATMILMEMAFIALWVGIILGAMWADVSWGRPWGWDPKEVFALNTWIIFLILVHVRLKVRDKGLWTAVLAVVGFVVMMFNWIGVNFWISGLHSYA